MALPLRCAASLRLAVGESLSSQVFDPTCGYRPHNLPWWRASAWQSQSLGGSYSPYLDLRLAWAPRSGKRSVVKCE